MDVQLLDPDDDDAVARTADQLGVMPARLRQALTAIGNDVDKVKGWLASHPSTDSAQTTGREASA